MWRSGRSVRNVAHNIAAVGPVLVDLAELAPDDAALAADANAALAAARAAVAAARDTTPATADGARRWRAAADAVAGLHRVAKDRIGPSIGFAAGFNALDGD
jgi:predicted lipoprotein